MHRNLVWTLGLLFSASLLHADGWEVTASAGWESAYVDRGEQLSDGSFQGSVDVSLGGVFLGFWSSLALDQGEVEGLFEDEYEFYGGYGFDLGGFGTLEFGAIHHDYSHMAGIEASDSSIEAFSGLALELPLSPTLYLYYDFDQEIYALEASVSQGLPLALGLSLDLELKLGGVLSEDDLKALDGETFETYVYYNVSADLAFSLTDLFKVSAGVRYGGSGQSLIFDDGDDYNSALDIFTDTSNNLLYFGANVTVSF